MTRSRSITRLIRFALFVLAICVGWSCSNVPLHDHDEDSLGVVNFYISGTPATQEEFNRAMTMLHHMTYPQAREMFRTLSAHDSTCAMAYWGYAMTLFQPLWPTRPNAEQLRSGWEAVEKAKALAAPTRRERLLIASAEGFFRDPSSNDYWKRIRAWADGLDSCYAAYGDDDEIAALYALSLVATVPPDKMSSPNNARAAEILNRVLKNNPNHPGAMHYLIHANDAPGRERESRETLRAYAAIAPNNPHALHMPTHIYTRLGNWPEVIRGNVRAAEAALHYPAGDHGQFVWDEFPHAIEYMVYAYLQRGEDDSAAMQIARLRETRDLEPTFKTAFHLASTSARYALERKAWGEAAALVPRESRDIEWNRFPWPEAISWFAHGLGALHTGNAAEAQRSHARLLELETAADRIHEVLFTRHIRVLRLGLSAWIAEKAGAHDSSAILMTRAAELEVSTPKHAVTPGPTLPAYELLGDLYTEQRKFADALAAYRRAMETNPLRWNSLLGAARAARALNNLTLATEYYRQLDDIAGPSTHRADIQEVRSFLASR